MTEPTTRTVVVWVKGDNEYQETNPVDQVSVPWCQTHNVKVVFPDALDIMCWHQLVGTAKGECELLDPHVPDAVWKDTE